MTICFTGWDNRMIFILRKTLWVTESHFYCPISSFHFLISLFTGWDNHFTSWDNYLFLSISILTGWDHLFIDRFHLFFDRYHILTGLNKVLTGRDHFSLTGITFSMVLINFRLVEISFSLADITGRDHFFTGWDHFFNDQDHFSIGWGLLFVVNKITKDRIDESYQIPQTLHTLLRRWRSVGCWVSRRHTFFGCNQCLLWAVGTKCQRIYDQDNLF